jgi:hypothetical protein
MLDVLGAFYEKLQAKNWKLISSEKSLAKMMLVFSSHMLFWAPACFAGISLPLEAE